jgi:multidrug resistance efflux pump
MDVCSPKDGFVEKLFVHDKETVHAGARLIQMDSDLEDRIAERVKLLESIREIAASKYIGEELDLLYKIAQNGVDLANEQSNEAKLRLGKATTDLKIGAEVPTDFLVVKSRFNQAQFEEKRASYQQKQVEFAIARHSKTNALAKELSENHLTFVSKRKERLTIVAPRDGRVKLLVAEGSFAELGSVLIEIV